jgi:hypothetical protein
MTMTIIIAIITIITIIIIIIIIGPFLLHLSIIKEY